MILQQLYADADAIFEQTGVGKLPPSMYVLKPLRWILELDETGNPLPPFQSLQGDDKKGERGIPYLLPEIKRSSGVRPLLLADTPAYTLGLVFPDDLKGKDESRERERAAEKFAAFKTLVGACSEATGNPDVGVISTFLESWDPENPSIEIPAEMSGAHTVTFRIIGHPRPVDDPAVRGYWAALGRSDELEQAGEIIAAQCLLSGAIGPVEEMMPVAVKGIPGGQPTGTHLVSANLAAFESYGLKRAQTSPICRDAGERFGKALNALLASERHRKTVGNNIYVFWSRAGAVELLPFETEQDPAKVKLLLEAVQRGTRWAGDDIPNEAEFHLYGLSANAARAVVRSALDSTIGEIGQRQAAWFTRLEIIGPDGLPGRPLPLKTLAVAAYREFKDIAPNVEDALVQAVFGSRHALPESLLQAVVLRCRLDTENRVTYPRAALLKYIVTQDQALEESQKMITETAGEMLPAYHCGRLFAELEEIQRSALPGINATISDKFFGSASSAPASVFGILLSGAQDHLSKLRKTNEGAYFGAEKRLEEIMAEISGFPTTLPLKDQALFSLGYYHHRAAKRKDIADRAAAKKQARTTTSEGENL